jgi:hypothetical protein
MSGAGDASVSLNSFYGCAAVKASRPQERSSRNQRLTSHSSKAALPTEVDCLRIGIAGTSATVAPAATSRVTTAFAPTVVPSPMVMLRMTMAPRPIQTSRPMAMGAPMAGESHREARVERSSFESRMLAYSLIIVPRPRSAASEEWA